MRRPRRTYHGEEFDLVWDGTEDQKQSCGSLTGAPGSSLRTSTVQEMGERHGLTSIVLLDGGQAEHVRSGRPRL